MALPSEVLFTIKAIPSSGAVCLGRPIGVSNDDVTADLIDCYIIELGIDPHIA